MTVTAVIEQKLMIIIIIMMMTIIIMIGLKGAIHSPPPN